MTTPIELDLNAADIGVGLTLKTKDGKVISLDAYSVKEEPKRERVLLDDVKIGDTLKLRCGRELRVGSLLVDKGRGYACHASDGSLALYYMLDGRSNLHCEEDDVVEIIKAELPPVSMKGAVVGSVVTLRNGEKMTIYKVGSGPDGEVFYAGKGCYWVGSVGEDGRALKCSSQWDAIKVEHPSTIWRIENLLEKINHHEVLKVKMNHKEWVALTFSRIKCVFLSPCDTLEPGEFEVVFKKAGA